MGIYFSKPAVMFTHTVLTKYFEPMIQFTLRFALPNERSCSHLGTLSGNVLSALQIEDICLVSQYNYLCFHISNSVLT